MQNLGRTDSPSPREKGEREAEGGREKHPTVYDAKNEREREKKHNSEFDKSKGRKLLKPWIFLPSNFFVWLYSIVQYRGEEETDTRNTKTFLLPLPPSCIFLTIFDLESIFPPFFFSLSKV